MDWLEMDWRQTWAVIWRAWAAIDCAAALYLGLEWAGVVPVLGA